MRVRLTSGPSTVLAHGEVTTFQGHPLGLAFELPDATTYRIEFRFQTDPDLPGLRVDPTVEAAGMVLTCVNFDGADGRGSATPVVLGTQGELAYFLHFRVFRFGRTEDRTVHYTVYVVPVDAVKWMVDEG